MTLARLRSEEGRDSGENGAEQSEYRFQNTAAATGSLTVRAKGPSGKMSGKFGGKMKKLGMGILELVLGRK